MNYLMRFNQLILILGLAAVSVSISRVSGAASETPMSTPLSSRFPTDSAVHIEPILNYLVSHEDNHHLHTTENLLSATHPLKVGNAANSLAAHSLKMRKRNGLKQPFPNTISISFRAHDRDFHFSNLQLDTKLFAENAQMEISDGEDQPSRFEPLSLNTYKSAPSSDRSSAVITLAEDGLITGTIFTDDETYQIDPLFVHAHEMEPEDYKRIQQAAPHSIVILKHSEIRHLRADGQALHCGSIAPPNSDDQSEKMDTIPDDRDDHNHRDHSPDASMSATSTTDSVSESSSSTPASVHRHLLSLTPGLSQVTRWNCSIWNVTTHKLSLGVAVDWSYTALYNSTGAIQTSIANQFASVNALYMAQFNVFLEITTIYIKTVSDSVGWNTAQLPVISDQLIAFANWRGATRPKTNSLWHLVTQGNSTLSGSTIGLAYMSSVCNPDYSAGVSYTVQPIYQLSAHEIGHNLGASHSPSGEGGIMEPTIGHAIYPTGSGIVQFNIVNEPQICSLLSSAISTTGITPYCWTNATFISVCGNGVTEVGEDCDDSTICCSACKLVGQCTPGDFNVNECCSSTCMFKPTSSFCTNGKGYCSAGSCTFLPDCSTFGYVTCGLDSNGCALDCGSTQYSNLSPCDPLNRLNYFLNSGSVCNTTSYGTCSSMGLCVKANPPSMNVFLASDYGSCSCMGVHSRTVQCTSYNGTILDDSYCNYTKPATTEGCTPPSSCYQWLQTNCSDCNMDCGDGTQQCQVVCVQDSNSTAPGATVSSSLCLDSAPAASISCNLGSCPTEWVTGGWNECSTRSSNCNGGTQTRALDCIEIQNGLNLTIDSGNCTTPVPTTSQLCNTQICIDGEYVYGSWSRCNVSCGGGIQERSYQCVNSTNGLALGDDTHCAYQGAPIISQSCNTNACPTYTWNRTVWSPCSVSCGGGIQSASYVCIEVGSTAIVNDSDCSSASTQPIPVTHPCNTNTCVDSSSTASGGDSARSSSSTAGGGDSGSSSTTSDNSSSSGSATSDNSSSTGGISSDSSGSDSGADGTNSTNLTAGSSTGPIPAANNYATNSANQLHCSSSEEGYWLMIMVVMFVMV